MPLELEKGSRVIIKHGLSDSLTEQSYNLDDKGNMLSMQGKCFVVDTVINSEKIRIKVPEFGRSYVFHPDDLKVYDIEPEPIMFNFDPELLELNK